MTDKAIELAKECGFWHSTGNVGELYYAYPDELTRFYNRAQAAALREAADECDNTDVEYNCDGTTRNMSFVCGEKLRRMAEEKEEK